MVKALRVIAGIGLAGLILRMASLATRDCAVGLFVDDNCWWLWVRDRCGLPASKFLRAGFLELVGLAFLAALFLTFRYVFPPWRSGIRQLPDAPTGPPRDEPESHSS
jgi:hypothetical protein